jgi:DUF1009 family protein
MQPEPAPTIEPQKLSLPSRLGVIAEAGAIPIAVCEAAQAKGIEVFVAALRGQAGPDIERFPHRWIRIGELGGMIGALKKAGCEEIVIVGALRRPNIWRAGMDFGFIRHLPTILSLTRGGDDTILKRVVRFFEAQGFTVRGAHEFAPSLLAPAGPCGAHGATEAQLADIRHGLALLDALAPFDVGQGVVVSHHQILAVEAAEGTDGMLKRCGGLHQWGRKGRSGVLVKAPKAGQELRVDMPVIGPRTVENAAAAGLAGIAVMSGQVMIADQAETISLADRHGIFLMGIDRTA